MLDEPGTEVIWIGQVSSEQWREGTTDDNEEGTQLSHGNGQEEETGVASNISRIAVVGYEGFDERIVTIQESPHKANRDRNVEIAYKRKTEHANRVN